MRSRQQLIGRALLHFDPRDRLACFVLPRFLRTPLLFCRAPFHGNLLLFARDSICRIAARCQLQVEADDRLLLAVELTLEGQNRRLRGSHDHVERAEVVAQPIDRGALDVGALAQLLDLALGGQDSGVSARTPPATTWTREDFALQRRDRFESARCGIARRVEAACNQALAMDAPMSAAGPVTVTTDESGVRAGRRRNAGCRRRYRDQEPDAPGMRLRANCSPASAGRASARPRAAAVAGQASTARS